MRMALNLASIHSMPKAPGNIISQAGQKTLQGQEGVTFYDSQYKQGDGIVELFMSDYFKKIRFYLDTTKNEYGIYLSIYLQLTQRATFTTQQWNMSKVMKII